MTGGTLVKDGWVVIKGMGLNKTHGAWLDSG